MLVEEMRVFIMSSVITLLTDFGDEDGYVASMKGVVLSIDPSATLVDITHQIRPQDIMEAAFVIDSTYSYFPKNTIHMVVVDPGVGSSRNALLACVLDHYFLAPDNGALSYVLSRWLEVERPEGRVSLHRVEVPEDSSVVVYRLANETYFLSKVSQTFHGRDIFAPVAAHLSKGALPDELGERISYIHLFSLPKPREEDGCLVGEVIYIDRFGNLITNVSLENVSGKITIVTIAGRVIAGLSASYIEGQAILAIVGSSGRLEIAAKNGNAASVLQLDIGATVEVKVSH